MFRFFRRLFCGRTPESETPQQLFDRTNATLMQEATMQEAADRLAVLLHRQRPSSRSPHVNDAIHGTH